MVTESLPTGWVSTTLGEAFRWRSGGTPRRTVSKYYGGSIPWAVIGDLNDQVVYSTAESITQLGLEASNARIVDTGSILLAMYGSIGKLGIAGMDLATNQAIAFTRTDPIYNRYLLWFLRASREDLLSQGRGGTQSNISQTVIKGFPFLLPPLNEQRRIVAEIEKQFTRLDASVASLKRVQASLKRYRASVLKAACEGRLVLTEAELALTEGRDYEPADQLLERILAERRECWESREKRRGKYKEPAPPNTSELPELPEGWVWSGISTLTYNFDALRVPVKAKDRAEIQGQYPYYGASGVIDSVESYLFDGIFLLIAEDGANLLSRSTPIAFVVSGKFWVNNHAHVLKLVGKLPAGYLETYINGLDVRQHVTGTAQPKLTQAALNRIPLPLPPLAEQHRIVAEVERRLSLIQKAEDVVESNLKKADRLRQSILKRAFSGQLVPQDPNDKPASVLLERIKAEREDAEANEKNAKRARRRRGKKTIDRETAI